MKKNPQDGFTLVEFSIVMIIIGLVLGGILVGNDLIKASKLRSVVREVEEYKTAINAFKLKYNDLPGNIENAFDYWPDTQACGVAGSAADTDWHYCNGTGDGQINRYQEAVKVWRHLSLAELIEYTFRRDIGNGRPYVASDCGVGSHGDCPSQTIPSSTIEKAGYEFSHTTLIGSPDDSLFDRTGHMLVLGKDSLGGSSNNNGPSLNVQDAMSLDLKADDGTPSGGSIIVTETHSVPGDCTTNGAWWNADVGLSSDWISTDKTESCVVFFMMGF